MLEEALYQQPILKYPNTSKPYILFTDASKHGWAGVLTQPYEEIDDSNPLTAKKWPTKVIHHPITYVSGLFRGSQLNWAALTKEAYTIYLLVKKLSFYLANADVLIRSDHLPLKKFLSKNTMDAKVNNWAVELETYNLKFEYIQGIKNTLVDTLSRLIEIDPDVDLPLEKPGQELGYNFFEDLPPVKVGEIIIEGIEIKPDPDTFLKEIDLNLPLKPRSIRSLQVQDVKINMILQRLEVGELDANAYLIEDGILKRRIMEQTGNGFKPIVFSQIDGRSCINDSP